MAKQFDIVQTMRLIGSGHWHGMGTEWLHRKAQDAADEIERLKAIMNEQGDKLERLLPVLIDVANYKPRSDVTADTMLAMFQTKAFAVLTSNQQVVPTRCAECDCDNPPNGCTWMRSGK